MSALEVFHVCGVTGVCYIQFSHWYAHQSPVESQTAAPVHFRSGRNEEPLPDAAGTTRWAVVQRVQPGPGHLMYPTVVCTLADIGAAALRYLDNTGHKCSLKEAKILDKEDHVSSRRIKEAIRIHQGRPGLQGHRPGHLSCHPPTGVTWCRMFHQKFYLISCVKIQASIRITFNHFYILLSIMRWLYASLYIYSIYPYLKIDTMCTW